MTAKLYDFQTLLTEAGIEFKSAPDFAPCPVRENSVFHYQYAERSPGGDLEVRYRIDSFARMEAGRKMVSEEMEILASVSLNHLHTANFMATLFNLSGGMYTEPTVFKPETTTLLYGANWCALGFVRIADNAFTPDYDSAYVFAIHKTGVADVYVIGLYNDIGGATGNFDKNNLPAIVKSSLAPNLRFT